MAIIGIISSKYKSEEGHAINVVYTNIVSAVVHNGGLAIGLVLDENYKKYIDICDGIIFQGGNDFEEYYIEALKYIYDIDKPVLGICLGMQLMAMLFSGKMTQIKNHKKNLSYAHSILVNKNSKLYNILKKDYLKVNSRHKSIIKNTKLKISAISNDGVIEAVEDFSKKFFVGIQWHPEDMILYDDTQNNLFRFLIKSCS